MNILKYALLGFELFNIRHIQWNVLVFPRAGSCLEIVYTCMTSNQFIIKVYDKREDFNFDIVNFPHLDNI